MKNKLLLCAWVSFWLGMSCCDVGKLQPQHEAGEKYDWMLPVAVMMLILPGAVLAYSIGREDERAKGAK